MLATIAITALVTVLLVLIPTNFVTPAPYTLAAWRRRPFRERIAEAVVLPVKSQL